VTRPRRAEPCAFPEASGTPLAARPVTPAPPPAPIILGTQQQTPAARLPGWRPNGTRDWLLIYTVEGEGKIQARGGGQTLRAGDVLLIAPNTPQEYGLADGSSGWSNIWAHFRPPIHWLSWLDWPELSRGIAMLSLAPERRSAVETELRHAVACQTSPVRLRSEAAVNALERALIVLDESNPNHGGQAIDPRIAAAVRVMGESLGREISIIELSRVAGLSRSRFTVLFTEQLKMSPQAYLEAARLGRAADLLRASHWSIGEVAEEVGYANPFYFSTRFRRYFGCSPTRYRAHGPEGIDEASWAARPLQREP
jgi:AraC family transcriptional regulator, arabinose operon regulatory protein